MNDREKEHITLSREEFLAAFDKKPPTDLDDMSVDSASNILHSAKEKNNSRTELFSDIGPRLTVDATITKEELLEIAPYYEQTLAQLMSVIGASNSNNTVTMVRGHHGHLSKKNGEISFTHTWTDPIFLITDHDHNPTYHSMPGTITSHFAFHPETGFELKQVDFSTQQLYQLIKNPLKILGISSHPSQTKKAWAKLEEAAVKTDVEQNPGKHTLTAEKLRERYPSTRGMGANPILETYERKVDDAEHAPSFASHLVVVNSHGNITMDIDYLEQQLHLSKHQWLLDKNGHSVLRTTITDPVFLEERGKYSVKIAGTVTTDYIYTPEDGLKFKSMTASNAVLYRFILNPPQAPTKADLVAYKNSAIEAEKKSQEVALRLDETDLREALETLPRSAQKIVDDLLEDFRKPHKLKPDEKAQLDKDKGRLVKKIDISEAQEAHVKEYFQQPLFALPSFIMATKTTGFTHATTVGRDAGYFYNDPNGQIILRIESNNPRFIIHDAAYEKDIPGKMVTEYILELGKGFTLRELKFSNKPLKEVVMNPPKHPNPKYLDAMAKQAAVEEKANLTNAPKFSEPPKALKNGRG